MRAGTDALVAHGVWSLVSGDRESSARLTLRSTAIGPLLVADGKLGFTIFGGF
jgi:hypothetical protein